MNLDWAYSNNNFPDPGNVSNFSDWLLGCLIQSYHVGCLILRLFVISYVYMTACYLSYACDENRFSVIVNWELSVTAKRTSTFFQQGKTSPLTRGFGEVGA